MAEALYPELSGSAIPNLRQPLTERSDPMRIVICDDEESIRTHIARLVRAHDPACEIITRASAAELLADAREPDLVFLDIQMPGISGMQAAQQLRRRGSRAILVFITALEQYVFQAFDVGAFHYLVKPFSEEKFREIFAAAVRAYEEQNKALQPEERCLLIQHCGSHFRVRLSDIIYAEIYNRKVILHIKSGQLQKDEHMFYKSSGTAKSISPPTEEIEYYGRLGELEAEAGRDFFRCHRSYLVNFQYVERYDAAAVYLEYGGQAIMAKKNYPEFVRQFLQYNKRTRDLPT